MMFDSLKNLFTKKELSPKEQATKKGEPWVNVTRFELDTNNPGQGSFELDWNPQFVAWLKQNGYPGDTDDAMVDQWFQRICRHVAMETWEEYGNIPPLVRRTPIDRERSSYS
jgi:hypothetical protein